MKAELNQTQLKKRVKEINTLLAGDTLDWMHFHLPTYSRKRQVALHRRTLMNERNRLFRQIMPNAPRSRPRMMYPMVPTHTIILSAAKK